MLKIKYSKENHCGCSRNKSLLLLCKQVGHQNDLVRALRNNTANSQVVVPDCIRRLYLLQLLLLLQHELEQLLQHCLLLLRCNLGLALRLCSKGLCLLLTIKRTAI